MSFVRTSNYNATPGYDPIDAGGGGSIDLEAVKVFIEENAYEEQLLIVAGSPANDNEMQVTGADAYGVPCVLTGTVIALPPDGRGVFATPEYKVGTRVLWIEGLDRGVHWQEVGTPGDLSSSIMLLRDVYVNETLIFRMYFARGT